MGLPFPFQTPLNILIYIHFMITVENVILISSEKHYVAPFIPFTQ